MNSVGKLQPTRVPRWSLCLFKAPKRYSPTCITPPASTSVRSGPLTTRHNGLRVPPSTHPKKLKQKMKTRFGGHKVTLHTSMSSVLVLCDAGRLVGGFSLGKSLSGPAPVCKRFVSPPLQKTAEGYDMNPPRCYVARDITSLLTSKLCASFGQPNLKESALKLESLDSSDSLPPLCLFRT